MGLGDHPPVGCRGEALHHRKALPRRAKRRINWNGVLQALLQSFCRHEGSSISALCAGRLKKAPQINYPEHWLEILSGSTCAIALLVRVLSVCEC